MVYYRKYRPQSLEELVGQTAVKSTLSKAFKEGKLAHAYLFCGPRGTGKTSTARILAKMINCEKKSSAINHQLSDKTEEKSDDRRPTTDDFVPCNSCQTCVSITDGTNLDLIEIDAASNRGIDDIRTLRENIKLAPTAAKKKVYIIDEVHMLSTEAFNALLKTLEEPPFHVVFILATTELQKIPVTILSRVQRLDFQLASIDEMIVALKRVIDSESLEVEEEALNLIARRSEGSFRDGVKILDQLASRGEKITPESVSEILKTGSFNQSVELIDQILQKNTKTVLEKVSTLVEQGVSLKEFTISLTENLRHLLLLKNGAAELVKKNLSIGEYEHLDSLATKSQHSQLILTIKSLQEALEKMKTTSLPQLALEVGLIESCGVVSDQPLVISHQSDSVILVSEVHPESNNQGDFGSLPRTSIRSQNDSTPVIIASKKQPNDETIIEIQVKEKSEGLTALQDKWTYILETVKPHNFSLEALLRTVKLRSCDDQFVTLEVPYAFHQRIIEAPKNRDLLEAILTDVLSRPIKLATIIGERPINIDDVANVELAADDEIIKVAAEIFSSDSVGPNPDSATPLKHTS